MAAWFQKKTPDAAAGPRAAGSVAGLLSEKTVLLADDAAGKDAVLRRLVEAAASAHGLGPAEPLLQSVLERERGISTTLDSGLSLPHARLDGIERVAAALAIVPEGVVDPKQPDVKVRAMFVFFSPNRPEAFSQHLQLLRAVSSLFKPDLIARLCALKTPAEILAGLTAAEA